MNKIKAISITGLVTLIVTALAYYILLPPLNIKSQGLWLFVIAIIGFASLLLIIMYQVIGADHGKLTSRAAILILVLIGVFLLGNLTSSVILRSRSYSKLISSNITEHDFEDYGATLGNVPLLDKDSAMNIANRKLGGLQDVISQYEINDSEQITVRGEPARVATLNHAGFFKWLSNRNSGTPGYIKVDMNTQEAELVRVEGGMTYTKSDYFGRHISRYLRFRYPTKIFWESTLELDESDHPYWVTAILDKTIGLFGGTDVRGAVIVDAVTGEHTEYGLEDIPKWVDNVYGSRILVDQYDKYGMYQKGFINSLIGQKGVKRSTDGYNYIPQGDDNWIYTGITSVARDESNIGFLLVNKRTKEARTYTVSGAEEFSAMESAEGAIQHLAYRSTFPLLLKIEGEPTYLVSLKDSGGLVKMYGMVNVKKYQIVATGASISDTLSQYKKLLRDNGVQVTSSTATDVAGIIEDIRVATVEGNSNYFVKIKNNPSYYLLEISDNKKAAILSIGDPVKLNIEESSDDIIPAKLQ